MQQSSSADDAKIEELRNEIEVLEDLDEDVQDADSIAETVLSELFHEARTTSKRHWKSASAFVNIDEDGIDVDHVEKISDGHWSPETRNRYDAIVSVPILPFMVTPEFKQAVRAELRQQIQGRQDNLSNLETVRGVSL